VKQKRKNVNGVITPPRPAHRPTGYRPDLCASLVAAMSRGFTFAAWAGMPGIDRDRDTVFAWAAKYPEFLGALKSGKAKRQLFWERRLAAFREGSPTTIIFALKNCCREDWNDRPDVAVTLHNSVQVGTAKAPEERSLPELRAELARLRALPLEEGGAA